MNNIFRRLLAATLSVAVLASPIIAQAQATADKNLIPVNIGLPISNYWPAYIARDLKLFEKAGLKPTFYMFQSGAPLIAGMKSGSLDVAWTGLATLFMLGQRIPLKFILVPLDSSSQMAYVVNPKTGIASYKDMGKSKNIAAPTATCAEVSMVMAAKRAGVDLNKVKSSNLAPNLIQKALDDGQVDSAFMWGPWNLEWRNAGYKIVSYDKDYMNDGGVCATTVAMRPAYLSKHPDVGCKLIQVQAWALEAAKKDPAHAIRTMQEAFNISPELARETYETLIIPSIESQVEKGTPWSLSDKSAGLTEKLYEAGQALKAAHSINVDIPRKVIEESVDDTYVRQFSGTKLATKTGDSCWGLQAGRISARYSDIRHIQEETAMGTMRLNTQEQAMLDGEMGKALQDAIKFQMEVGNFFEARRFVPISNAHLMGDIEVMGDAGLNHLRRMARGEAHCSVPTSSNAQCMHFQDVHNIRQDDDEIRKEKEIVAMLKDMRVATTDTCINYQTVYQPKLGEHVAWGDTGTVIYANSVFGARTNYEAGYSSFAASLTGRTPAYGFHLDSYRRGSILVDLQARMRDLADWGAVGKLVGHPNQNYASVPVFDGVGAMPSSDALKHLGASLASYGSMAMFHMVGVTPEAPSAAAAFGGRKAESTITITDADLEAVYGSFRYAEGGHNIVVFSGPQQSIFEMQRLAELFDGRRISPDVQVFVTTNRAVYNDAKSIGYVDTLEKAGAVIMQGVCFYILQGLSKIREANGWTNLISNSGKLVNTITAHRFNTVLRRTEACVDIACTGRLQ